MHHFPKPSLSFSYSPTRSAQWTLYRPCTALYKAPSKRRSGCVPLPSLCFVVCSPVSPLVLPPLCTLPLCAHPVDVALRAGLLSTAPFLCLSLIPREALHASLVSLLFSLLALLSFGPSAHISLSLSADCGEGVNASGNVRQRAARLRVRLCPATASTQPRNLPPIRVLTLVPSPLGGLPSLAGTATSSLSARATSRRTHAHTPAKSPSRCGRCSTPVANGHATRSRFPRTHTRARLHAVPLLWQGVHPVRLADPTRADAQR